jgi:hypothetical protein
MFAGLKPHSLTLLNTVIIRTCEAVSLPKSYDQLLEEHPKEIRVVSPRLSIDDVNDKAALAAQAAEAAGEQNKFWEMHHLLYAQQENWVKLTVPISNNGSAPRSQPWEWTWINSVSI